MTSKPPRRTDPPGTTHDTTGRKNMHQLVQLRWIAVLGQIATISTVHFGLGIRLPLEYMGLLVLGLVAFNIASLLRVRMRRNVTHEELLVALVVDVSILTGQLYLSGGAANPFAFLYLLQVSLAAVLLRPWSTLVIVCLTVACFAGLAVVADPLDIPRVQGAFPWSPYVQGLLICFGLNASLLVIFIGRINRNLRARDARLATLRQRAAEEDHIVRMGLLASGAAHELGTPLSTLAVILGDWRRMAPFNTDPDIRQELDEMQNQVQRCKSIVSGILMSAGETRGESPTETTVHRFLDDLVVEWRQTRPVGELAYENMFGPDLRIVSDTAIKQMIFNVLDNALEASPQWIAMDVEREGDQLKIEITDDGPGFDRDILARVGAPYNSTKGRAGGGLGLFLAMNVARTLGGSVSAVNRLPRGAGVTLTLPLSSITLEEAPHE